MSIQGYRSWVSYCTQINCGGYCLTRFGQRPLIDVKSRTFWRIDTTKLAVLFSLKKAVKPWGLDVPCCAESMAGVRAERAESRAAEMREVWAVSQSVMWYFEVDRVMFGRFGYLVSAFLAGLAGIADMKDNTIDETYHSVRPTRLCMVLYQCIVTKR